MSMIAHQDQAETRQARI